MSRPAHHIPQSSDEGDSIPLHVHGISRYYFDRGCLELLCIGTVAKAKAKVRANHRAERTLIDGRWVHPALAAFDSDAAARHGTPYARRDFGCECPDCRPGMHRPLATLGGLLGPTAWHLNDRLIGGVALSLLALMLCRANYEHIAAHPAVRRAALILLDVATGALLFTFVSLIVATLVAYLTPYHGKHRTP